MSCTARWEGTIPGKIWGKNITSGGASWNEFAALAQVGDEVGEGSRGSWNHGKKCVFYCKYKGRPLGNFSQERTQLAFYFIPFSFHPEKFPFVFLVVKSVGNTFLRCLSESVFIHPSFFIWLCCLQHFKMPLSWFLAPGYSNTNLSTAMKGFCRCN